MAAVLATQCQTVPYPPLWDIIYSNRQKIKLIWSNQSETKLTALEGQICAGTWTLADEKLYQNQNKQMLNSNNNNNDNLD